MPSYLYLQDLIKYFLVYSTGMQYPYPNGWSFKCPIDWVVHWSQQTSKELYFHYS